jgi:prevent-host-death family protein
MAAVSAREANQQFSKLLQRAVAGEEVVITRRGKPVAKLVPVTHGRADADREREIAAFIAHLREGVPGGKIVDWTRDEIYDEAIRDRGKPWP